MSKGTVSKAPLGKLPLVETLFSVICVDIVGPVSRPSEGYRYILTTIDMCTRFPEAVPLKDISTSTVAEALLNMFSRVGLPHRIHSDRGSQFTSEMMREVYRLLDIRQSTMQWGMELLRINYKEFAEEGLCRKTQGLASIFRSIDVRSQRHSTRQHWIRTV